MKQTDRNQGLDGRIRLPDGRSLSYRERGGNWEGWGGVRAFYELAQTDVAALKSTADSLAQNPAVFLSSIAGAGAEVDKRLLAAPAVWDTFRRDAGETFRAGSGAAVRDTLLCANPWGFDCGNIRTPTFLWHGLDDLHAPPAMAKYLAAVIRGCRVRFYPGEGHLLMFTRWREILASLAG